MIIYETAIGVRLLIYLYKNGGEYGQNVAYALRITYSYLSNLLTEFDNMGLISKTKIGRINKLNLTHKGKEVAKKLIEIDNLMK